PDPGRGRRRRAGRPAQLLRRPPRALTLCPAVATGSADRQRSGGRVDQAAVKQAAEANGGAVESGPCGPPGRAGRPGQQPRVGDVLELTAKSEGAPRVCALTNPLSQPVTPLPLRLNMTFPFRFIPG